MSSIVSNQRASYLAQATDAARGLADQLRNLSPAEQAAILATVTAAIGCPIDLVLLTGDRIDGYEAAAILDGVLARSDGARWEWRVGSGCHFRIQMLPKETIL